MKKLGYEEGRDIVLDLRWAENRTERYAPLAAELVASDPAVIVTGTSAGIAASKKATSTIPIVFATAASPVEQGFVSSLRRPGGNITGVIVYGIEAKTVEFAREAFPAARRLAFVVFEPDPVHKLMLEAFLLAAKQFRFDPVIIRVSRSEDLSLALADAVRQKAEALFAPPLGFVFSHKEYLVEWALKSKMPLLCGYEEFADAGALLSYGTDRLENYRRVAVLVDKILRGAKPGELPVDQPEKFQLVVNLKTAKAIGVTLSKATLARADRIIE